MAAKNTIKDERSIKQEVSKEVEPTKLPENTPNVDKLRGDEDKTKAPKQEALSHKPTFGDAAERPGLEQDEPEGDHTIPTGQEPLNPANPATQPSTSTEDKTSPGARIMGEKHQENLDQIAELVEEGGAEKAQTETPENKEAQADAQTDENQKSDASAKEVEDHPDAVQTDLQRQTDLQGSEPDPDGFQRSIHQNTTEDLLRAPQRRPATIDPMTGQVHYAGDTSELNGGTIAHEGDDA